MAGWLFSKIGSALRRVDSIAEKALAGLHRLYTVLAEKLDGALEKLDEVTKALLRRYYRALNYLEKLFGILRKLLRVIFPILFLFTPPALGFVITFFAYNTYFSDSIVLGCMCVVLLLILVASFRSRAETTGKIDDPKAESPLAITAELDSLGTQRKVLGAIVAFAALALSAYLSVGLLVGILLFITEVMVLYVLKWMYGTGESAPNPIIV